MRSCLAIAIALSVLGLQASQAQLLNPFNYTGAPGQNLGFVVSDAGDVNNDGFDDMIVGGFGAALVLSGQSETPLYQISLGPTGVAALFGVAVSGAGDVNNDGFDDMIVGAPAESSMGPSRGRAVIFSGIDGAILFTIDGFTNLDRFGQTVTNLGDVNSDNFDDFAVGAPKEDDPNGPLQNNTGSVRIFSGATGLPLYPPVYGNTFNEELGTSLARAGDIDNDGVQDLIAGSLLDDQGGIDAGSVTLISGATGMVITIIVGTVAGDQFGTAVSAAGRVDGDMVDDFMVGTPLHDTAGMDSGRVTVYSGANFMPITNLDGAAAGDGFGSSIDGPGDIDGDTIDDLIIGSPGAAANGPLTGNVVVLSTMGFTQIASLDGDGTLEAFGLSVSGAGDINMDGRIDIIVGAPSSTALFPNNTGHARTYMSAFEYAGTKEDVRLDTGINGNMNPYAQKVAVGSDTLCIRLTSPNQTLNIFPPFIAGQFFVTGGIAPSAFGFPEIHLDPDPAIQPAPVSIYDGNMGGPFAFPGFLPAGGINLGFNVPGTLSGFSFIIQGILVDLALASNNGFFFASDATEIQFM